MASQIDDEPSTTLPLTHRLLKWPEFWPLNVSGYFRTIETIFSRSGITEETPKYSSLIQTLSKHQQTLTKVADILENLNQDEPCTQPKTSLLARLCSKIEESPYTILKQCTKGGNTITESLIRIKVALGTNYDSHSPILINLISHHFLEAVVPQVKINLSHYESASLEQLARHADHHIARLKQHHKSQPTPYPGKKPSSNQSLINEVLESLWDLLQISVNKLPQSKNHSITKLSHTPKSHLRAPDATTTDLLIRIRLHNYVGVVNHGFAIITTALAIVLGNVKDTSAPEEILPLHLHIFTTFSFPLPNLLTTAYFSLILLFKSNLKRFRLLLYMYVSLIVKIAQK